MKFQNGILINFVTDAHTDKSKAICPFDFSKVGDITKHDFKKIAIRFC